MSKEMANSLTATKNNNSESERAAAKTGTFIGAFAAF